MKNYRRAERQVPRRNTTVAKAGRGSIRTSWNWGSSHYRINNNVAGFDVHIVPAPFPSDSVRTFSADHRHTFSTDPNTTRKIPSLSFGRKGSSNLSRFLNIKEIQIRQRTFSANQQKANRRICWNHWQQLPHQSYQSQIAPNLLDSLMKKCCGLGNRNQFTA